MNKTAYILLAAYSLVGLTACGDTSTVRKTTEIDSHKQIDANGHEKTVIETKTTEVDEKKKDLPARPDHSVQDSK